MLKYPVFRGCVVFLTVAFLGLFSSWAPAAVWLDAMNVPAGYEYTGAGIVVAVVDSGIQTDHPRLAGSMYTTPSLDYHFDGTPGPGATTPSSSHGTSVAGCVLGFGNFNAGGGSDVLASGAKLVSVSLPFNVDLSLQFMADIISYGNDTHTIQIKNNSWGEPKGFAGISGWTGSATEFTGLWSGPILDAFREAGTAPIYIFSAGNERDKTHNNGKDANKKAFQAHPQTITVAAMNQAGTSYTGFSCFGANIFVGAPGSGIDTTSTGSGYNTGFTGTSASAPLVSGVAALVAEAAQQRGLTLDTRLFKHLIAETAVSTGLNVDLTDMVKFVENHAGKNFSHTYGFGRINAKGMIDTLLEKVSVEGGGEEYNIVGVTPQTVLTAQWDVSGAMPQLTFSSEEKIVYISHDKGFFAPAFDSTDNFPGVMGHSESVFMPVFLNLTLYDDDSLFSGEITVSPNAGPQLIFGATAIFDPSALAGFTLQPLEEVTVTLAFSAERLGDIQVELTSPWGTKSILCFADNTSNTKSGDIMWTFTSNAFWGEEILDLENESAGWKLEVYDYDFDDNYGTSGVDDLIIYENQIFSTFYMGRLVLYDEPDDEPGEGGEVPEPATWAMILLGGVLLAGLRRKTRNSV